MSVVNTTQGSIILKPCFVGVYFPLKWERNVCICSLRNTVFWIGVFSFGLWYEVLSNWIMNSSDIRSAAYWVPHIAWLTWCDMPMRHLVSFINYQSLGFSPESFKCFQRTSATLKQMQPQTFSLEGRYYNFLKRDTDGPIGFESILSISELRAGHVMNALFYSNNISN